MFKKQIVIIVVIYANYIIKKNVMSARLLILQVIEVLFIHASHGLKKHHLSCFVMKGYEVLQPMRSNPLTEQSDHQSQ